jgi:hypothetical protein
MAISLVNSSTSGSAVQDIRKNLKGMVSKTHPAALIAWGVVGLILLAGVIFTGYHNWNLFSRGAQTDFGRTFAAIPPLLLDGSIVLLLILLLTYFRDRLQWWVAVLFNAVLFIIVGVNTSLDYSLSTGESLSDGMRLYLRWGIVWSFLLAFIGWEIIIHLDPRHKRQSARGQVEEEAEQETHELELELLKIELKQKKDDLEYEKKIQERMHASRMKATESDEVERALVDFEKGEAINKAKKIRGVLPKA